MEGRPIDSLKSILLVDDDDPCRITTKWFLTHFGYAVDSARSAEEALALFGPQLHDLVVTDNRMSGMTGAEMAHIIKMRSPSTPVLMHTALPPDDQSCLDGVIQKPAHLLALTEAIARLLGDLPKP
jgi:CheY-like chemotaxis protein